MELDSTYTGWSKERHEDGWDGQLDASSNVNNQAYPYENIGLYHNGKANAVFVDGHIEEITWNQTTNACSGAW